MTTKQRKAGGQGYAPAAGSVPPELNAKWRKLVKPIFFEMYRDDLDEVCIGRNGTEVTLKLRRNAEPNAEDHGRRSRTVQPLVGSSGGAE